MYSKNPKSGSESRSAPHVLSVPRQQYYESTGSSDSPGGTRRDTGCVTQPPAPRGSRGLPDLPVFHFFFLMRLHLAFVILMNLLGSCNSWSWRGACSDRNKSNLATVKHISGDSPTQKNILLGHTA